MKTETSTVRTLLTGLNVGESARWHAGRLWLANWGTGQIIAVDSDGTSEVVATLAPTIPLSIDWLPDGRLLAVSGREARLLRQEPDGTWATHADLSGLASGFNEIVLDGRGNIYVNGSDYNFGRGGAYVPGIIALVTPDGTVGQVADNIAFPNGMAVTPDNSTLIIGESYASCLTAFDIAPDGSLLNRRVWASTRDDHPDGICIDTDGAVWYAEVGNKRCVRVHEGGEVLNQIDLPDACFACMLGGPDGKTLFMLTAAWRGVEHMAELFQSQTGQVLSAAAPAPHAGYP
jgi:sugar lactone lactonase YvrE